MDMTETTQSQTKPKRTVSKKSEALKKAQAQEESLASTPEMIEESLVKLEEQAKTPSAKEPAKKSKIRGQKYVAAKSMVDRTKLYTIEKAVAMAKRTATSSFIETLEAHLVLKEELTVDVKFPHTTGQSRVVAIASDELLEQLERGEITFTVLVAHPSMMPKLAKFARLLGPKGLMPNPKTGTISPDPEKRKAELESGSITIRSEKKAPLMHVVLGKTSLTEEQLSENLRALFKAFPAGKLLRCTISSTMGPGIHVRVA